MGVLYILDEPSIGLHQRDNAKLLATLRRLRDLGNTLIVVEHDEETMREADYLIDIGPGAGVHGGEVVAAGTVEDICACERSITGQYLSGKKNPRSGTAPQGQRKFLMYPRRFGEQSPPYRRGDTRWAPSPASPACPAAANPR
jgi:excinuclease ABC subunit A